MSAWDDIASRMQVVDQPTWDSAPNAVTQKELGELVNMYKDIAQGRGDFVIDTGELRGDELEQTRAGMMENIARIMQTETGRYELRHLHDNVTMVDGKPVHHKTKLKAFHVNPDGTGPLAGGNSIVLPDNGRDGSMHFEDDRRVAGPGTDCTVLYTPQGQFPDGERSDVTLAHELVHALEYTSGRNDTAPIDGSDRVPADLACDPMHRPNRGEYQAVGIGSYENTNINENSYRIERRLIGEGGGPGVLAGDADMRIRDHYGCVD